MQAEYSAINHPSVDAPDQCTTCNHSLTGKFCSSCGQPAQLPRVNARYIIHEIEHILHFEKGILYTVKELLIRPGQNVKAFIGNNRSRLVKPVIFIITTSLVYTVISHFFHLESEYINYQLDEHAAASSIFSWISAHYGYANIIMGLFIAIWLKLFFKKHDYNVFEILILLCFVMGTDMLIYALFALAEGLTKAHLMPFAGMVGFAYCTWAIGQFFNRNKWTAYLKSLGAYILGLLTFCVAGLALGLIIDSLR